MRNATDVLAAEFLAINGADPDHVFVEPEPTMTREQQIAAKVKANAEAQEKLRATWGLAPDAAQGQNAALRLSEQVAAQRN